MFDISIYIFFAYVVTFFFGVFHEQGIFYNIPTLTQIENFHYMAIPFVFLGSILFYKKYIYHYVNTAKIVIEIKKNTLNIFIFIFILTAFYGYLNDYNAFRYNKIESTGLLYYFFRLLSYFYIYIIYLIFFGNSYKKNILEIIFYLTPLYFLIGGLSTAFDYLVILILVGIYQYREFFLTKNNIKKLINVKVAGTLALVAVPIMMALFISGIMIKENAVSKNSIKEYFASTWVLERFYPHHVSLKNSLKNHNKYKINRIKSSFIERKNILINSADKNILLRHDLNEHNNDIIYKKVVLLRSGSAPGLFGSIFYLFNNSVALIIIFCVLILLYMMFDRIVKNSECKHVFFMSFTIIYLFGRSYLAGPTTFLILIDESVVPFLFLIYITFIRTKFV